MNAQFHIPKGFLKDFVTYIVYINGDDSGTGVAFPRMHQVIIINMGTRFSSSDIYAPKPVVHETSDTIWINGKHDDPFMLENQGETAMYAIGLGLGMLPWFANLPAIETNGLALGAANWASREIYHLREQLQACPNVSEGFLLIEKHLSNMLRKKDQPALEKIKWLDKAINTRTVEDICQTLGVTRKKLRSETQHYFGGSVKNIQGIIRLNKTLTDIAHHADSTLSSLHNYYDQSHFINDFKSRTGITPLQYKKLCLRDAAIKYTPNFLPMSRETFLQFISH